MGIDEDIKKYGLQNAVKFNGRANPGAVIGKILKENPSWREDVKALNEKISSILKKVNTMTVEEQINSLKKIAPELLEVKKVVKVRVVPEVRNAVVGKVKMRFEPSVSGPLHIGHAYALSLNSEICRKYKGKLQLRIADTNPENIYSDAYSLIPTDAEWVTKNNISEVIVQSDRMEEYYKVCEELLKKEHAYVCTCKAEYFRELIKKSIPCECRKISIDENFTRWKGMLKDFEEGSAVVRIKTDIKHNNPAMRDWPALRIKLKEHPKTKNKYRVWPLLNFSVAVDDHLLGITHTVRAKDHMDNEKRQKFLYDFLDWEMPEHLYIGRINFADMRVSCSKTRPLIDDGTYSGWDDIRIPFLLALKRRGYQPESFIKYAIDVGISQSDKSVHKDEFFKTLNAFNREVIDGISNRYFFIEDPVEILISGAPVLKPSLKLHPDSKKEERHFVTNDKFYVSKEDSVFFKEGPLYRLMDCLNFKKNKGKYIFDSLDHANYKKNGKKIIHWLPKSKDLVKVEVLMPDNSVKKGFGESGISKLKEGDIIQFERFAFCKLDKIIKNKYIFWYGHK